ncbi:MAG: MarR family transcriptional regulator, partial [Pseudonocardiaceae bacterium]|nr:MarR family transcriptional regulator [Pseudonocardiaceae bacterium]
ADRDRRAVQLALTDAGHVAITSAFAAHNEREQAWASTLSRSEQGALIGLLEKLVTGPVAAEAKRRF